MDCRIPYSCIPSLIYYTLVSPGQVGQDIAIREPLTDLQLAISFRLAERNTRLSILRIYQLCQV
jgi:hypothetical protein